MPNDIAIFAPLNKKGLSNDQLRGVANTNFVFQPFENDIQFDQLKRVRTVSGVTKLVQSILRLLLTDTGSYFEDGDWGSSANNQIGGKFDSEKYATSEQGIIDALKHYNEINRDNPNPDEVINTIDELRVVQDTDDPRKMRIYIGITTESGQSFQVSVPQVV